MKISNLFYEFLLFNSYRVEGNKTNFFGKSRQVTKALLEYLKDQSEYIEIINISDLTWDEEYSIELEINKQTREVSLTFMSEIHRDHSAEKELENIVIEIFKEYVVMSFFVWTNEFALGGYGV